MKAYIFECSTNTYRECLERQIFGSFLDWPLEVCTGDLCLLYHHGIAQLSGIWQAESAGKHDLVPAAWGGRFPFQVKVRPTTPHILELAWVEVKDLLGPEDMGRFYPVLEGERLGELVQRFQAVAQTIVD